MAGNSNWTIVEACIQDIDEVFDSTADLVKLLDTNTGTWSKIIKRDGVKQKTARMIVRSFVSLLSDANDGADIDGIAPEVARHLLESKYSTYLPALKVHDLLEEVNPRS